MVYDWSLLYNPNAEDGLGSIRMTLGQETITHVMRKGIKAEGGTFDRFGLFTSTIGGQVVRVYLGHSAHGN